MLFLLLCILPDGFNHPEIKWKVLETKNFYIIYQENYENIALKAKEILEGKIFEISKITGGSPLLFKIPVVLCDIDNISNGFASPVGYYIFVWLKDELNLVTDTIDWLNRVLTHELTHLLNFYAFNFLPYTVYDIFSFLFYPAYFSEGTAQLLAEEWDYGRDLLLRLAFLNNKVLPFKRISGFYETDPIETRLLYEEGHSLLRFLVHQHHLKSIQGVNFGYKLLNIIFLNPFNFDLSFLFTTNKFEGQFFNRWYRETKEFYEKKYKEKLNFKNIHKINTPFKFIISYYRKFGLEIFVGTYDPEKLYFEICYRENDKLKIFDRGEIGTKVSLSPDLSKIVYSKIIRTKSGSLKGKLFVCELNKDKIYELENTEGAMGGAIFVDEEKIIFAKYERKGSNLYVLNMRDKKIEKLTNFGTDIYAIDPFIFKDTIYFLKIENKRRTLCKITGDKVKEIHRFEYYVRDFCTDNNFIYFISFRNGFMKIEKISPDDKKIDVLESFIGGISSLSISDSFLYFVGTTDLKRLYVYRIPKNKVKVEENTGLSKIYFCDKSYRVKKRNLNVPYKVKNYSSLLMLRPSGIFIIPLIVTNYLLFYLSDPLNKDLFLFSGNLFYDVYSQRFHSNFYFDYQNSHFYPVFLFSYFTENDTVGMENFFSLGVNFPFTFKDIYKFGYFNLNINYISQKDFVSSISLIFSHELPWVSSPLNIRNGFDFFIGYENSLKDIKRHNLIKAFLSLRKEMKFRQTTIEIWGEGSYGKREFEEIYMIRGEKITDVKGYFYRRGGIELRFQIFKETKLRLGPFYFGRLVGKFFFDYLNVNKELYTYGAGIANRVFFGSALPLILETGVYIKDKKANFYFLFNFLINLRYSEKRIRAPFQYKNFNLRFYRIPFISEDGKRGVKITRGYNMLF